MILLKLKSSHPIIEVPTHQLYLFFLARPKNCAAELDFPPLPR